MTLPPDQLKENIRRHLINRFEGRHVSNEDMQRTVNVVVKRNEQGNTLEEALEIGERVLEARID